MLKSLLCFVLVGSIVSLGGGRLALAADGKASEAAFTEKVKTAIAKLGTGPSAQVEVKLRNKAKLKGYIKEANDDGFVLADDKTGTTTEVAYPPSRTCQGQQPLDRRQNRHWRRDRDRSLVVDFQRPNQRLLIRS